MPVDRAGAVVDEPAKIVLAPPSIVRSAGAAGAGNRPGLCHRAVDRQRMIVV